MPKVILTDIEGTISSISFVKEVLFPYSKERLEDFILTNYEHSPFLLSIIEATLEEIKQGNITGIAYKSNQESAIFETQVYTAIEALKIWIQEDKKITPLKDLQGLIWEEGFRNGLFKAPLYQDAFEFFLSMKGKGLPIYVYSSGSVQAQKLFFEFSEFGDVRYLFSGFYDTKIGSKKDSESYLKIATDIQVSPEHILFLTDIKDECKASEEAGLLTVQVIREALEDAVSFDNSAPNSSAIERTRKVINDFGELSEIL
jgi:enolase-phosphatase E1